MQTSNIPIVNTGFDGNLAGKNVATLEDLAREVDDLVITNPPATTAANDFQVGNGAGGWVKKTLAETIAILRTSLDSIYQLPIGSIYIAVVSTNPATLLGYGTWSAFAAGRVLVGIDSGQTEFDAVEETGGAKTHTLAESEMPSHTHTQDAHAHGLDIRYATNTPQTGGADRINDIENTTGASGTAATPTGNNATATNQNTGGGGAHNNLQPYIVVYMWKRTA